MTMSLNAMVQKRLGVVLRSLPLMLLTCLAGCQSTATTGRLDVTITVDPTLSLQGVTLAATASGKPPYSHDLSLSNAATSVTHSILLTDLKTSTSVALSAKGIRGGSTIVTYLATAVIAPGAIVNVVMSLSGPCAGAAAPTCNSAQTCDSGVCTPIPIFGESKDAGPATDLRVDSSIGDARGTGGAANAGGRAGNSGSGGGITQTGGNGGAGGNVGGISPSGGTSPLGGTGGSLPTGGAGGAPTKLPQGTACKVASDCGTGFCTNGVCCKEACNGTCQACTNALTSSSPDGICAPIVTGTKDPKGGCTAAPGTCGQTGLCDGKGACELYGTTTSCGPAAACVANASGGKSFTPSSTCDGLGTCKVAVARDCGVYPCDPATGCAATCKTDPECQGGFCDQPLAGTRTCKTKKNDGSACAGNNECVNGACVAGICCQSACESKCYACAQGETGSADGLCRPIKKGGDSKSQCTKATTECGQDGTCDGNGGCHNVDQGALCGSKAATCPTANTSAGVPMCDGAGACKTPAAVSCGNLTCDTTSHQCKGSCAGDGDCTSGTHCEALSCKPDCKGQSDCGSNAICNNKRCMSCDAGSTACPNGCVNTSTSTSNCGICGKVCSGTNNKCVGGQCVQCGAPSDCNASGMTCVQGACVCSNGNHTCSGAAGCFSDADATHCGGTCQDCRQPNATAVCGGTKCANICNGAALSCSGLGGLAVCGSWDFESGTTEGWTNSSPQGMDGSGGILRADNSRASSGASSLALGHNNPAGDGLHSSAIKIHLCPTGAAVDLTGRVLEFSVYLAPTVGGDLDPNVNLEFDLAEYSGVNSNGLDSLDRPVLPAGQWIVRQFRLGRSSKPSTDLEIVFTTYSAPWSGIVYFDRLQIL